MMSKKVKIFAITVVALAALIGAFSYFSGSGSSTKSAVPAVAVPGGAMPGATGAMPAGPLASSTTTPGGAPSTGTPAAMPAGAAILPGGAGAGIAAGNTASANEFSGLLSSIN